MKRTDKLPDQKKQTKKTHKNMVCKVNKACWYQINKFKKNSERHGK